MIFELIKTMVKSCKEIAPMRRIVIKMLARRYVLSNFHGLIYPDTIFELVSIGFCIYTKKLLENFIGYIFFDL